VTSDRRNWLRSWKTLEWNIWATKHTDQRYGLRNRQSKRSIEWASFNFPRSQAENFQKPQSSWFLNRFCFDSHLWSPFLDITEKALLQVQAAEIRFLQRVRGVTLPERVHSCETRKPLCVEPLYRIERFQLVVVQPETRRTFGEACSAGYTHRNTLRQGFPTWGTCTPRGTFAYLQGYI